MRDNAQQGKDAGSIDMLDGHRLSVLVPALNEAENLKFVLPRIPTWVHEVVLIDDHCTDDTVAVARELMPDIVVVANRRPPGKGNALKTGMEAASGDMLVQVDADGSEDPQEIHAFVGALLAGADYAKGSRFIEGGGTSDMPALRKWGNWALVALVRMFFRGTKFTDLCYGYNAYWSRVAPLLLDSDGFEIETVMNIRAVRAKLRIFEIPSFETERIHGVGKLETFPDGWRVLSAILRERFRARPLETSGVDIARPAAVPVGSVEPARSVEPAVGAQQAPTLIGEEVSYD